MNPHNYDTAMITIPFDVIRSNIFTYFPIQPNQKEKIHIDIKKFYLKQKWLQYYKIKYSSCPNNDNYYYFWLENDIECFLNDNIPTIRQVTTNYTRFLKRMLGSRKHYTFSLNPKYTTHLYLKTLTYDEFLKLDAFLNKKNDLDK